MERERKKRTDARYDRPSGQRGAPILTVRLEPDVHAAITEHPMGARQYLEQLVREDLARKASAEK